MHASGVVAPVVDRGHRRRPEIPLPDGPGEAPVGDEPVALDIGAARRPLPPALEREEPGAEVVGPDPREGPVAEARDEPRKPHAVAVDGRRGAAGRFFGHEVASDELGQARGSAAPPCGRSAAERRRSPPRLRRHLS